MKRYNNGLVEIDMFAYYQCHYSKIYDLLSLSPECSSDGRAGMIFFTLRYPEYSG